ncbi:MAG: hypothetical protein ACREQ5_41260 [Candidatus Dormibacteria bacterium]
MTDSFMQRLFDTLAASAKPLTYPELGAVIRISASGLESAMQRLRDLRLIDARYSEGVWSYCLKAGAVRPSDRRGHKKVAA